MPTPTPTPPDIEICDELQTRAIPVIHLMKGRYVLLADDVEENEDDPLLIPADHPDPVLWRFVGLADPGHDQVMMMQFDGPDDDEVDGGFETLSLPVEPSAKIREVLDLPAREGWGDAETGAH